ncbi:molybdopterin converting factor subunit 1 [Sphingopyxis macrogoltabida]|uniref:Molybdenum cofactor biosynthesis protein MoaD n=1 Tax=Sphingopyxis macrogoltabida TaxID=33050 RepID=A0A0N9UXF1_SPHMC|nr:molybdopterin converting factor subunit 1 [Sphingopyxis macrogoltabida]ALH80194.1 molybdenum cofactor biosynthesis protein MoaD [Sphingopyxis macrogoltabida]
MRLTVSYFAWVRERMGVAEEEIVLPAGAATVGDLVGWLAARDERGALAFAEPGRIRAALGGAMVGAAAPLGDAREIALFPPVTGG